MQRVFVGRNLSEAHIVNGMLNAAGIAAEVRGHYLAGGYGELPITSDTLPSVWVREASQVANARSLVIDYERPSNKGWWTCEQCGETHGGQFTACWKCGMEHRAR